MNNEEKKFIFNNIEFCNYKKNKYDSRYIKYQKGKNIYYYIFIIDKYKNYYKLDIIDIIKKNLNKNELINLEKKYKTFEPLELPIMKFNSLIINLGFYEFKFIKNIIKDYIPFNFKIFYIKGLYNDEEGIVDNYCFELTIKELEIVEELEIEDI